MAPSQAEEMIWKAGKGSHMLGTSLGSPGWQEGPCWGLPEVLSSSFPSQRYWSWGESLRPLPWVGSHSGTGSVPGWRQCWTSWGEKSMLGGGRAGAAPGDGADPWGPTTALGAGL